METPRNIIIIKTEHGCFVESNDLVLLNILSRLPVKSLIRFTSVSKRWRSVIKRDKYLIHMHETRRRKHITSFLVYPTWIFPLSTQPQCLLPGSVNIRSIPFSIEDLTFDDDDHLGGGSVDSNTCVAPAGTLCYDVILNVKFNMLEPVYGLVCFINCNHGSAAGSVLIYNPCTGEKTPWIKTSQVFASNFGQEHVADDSGEGFILCYNHMFGFGFDPTTKQHKVLCVYEISKHDAWAGNNIDPLVVRHICGVLTVGDNTWRKIDDHKVPTDIALDKKCVYVNGSICWIQSRFMKSEVIVFDVGSETFRAITVPGRTRDVWSWYNINSEELVNKLIEVHGHIAVLVPEGDDCLDLWIYNDNGGNEDGNWIEETIQMPCGWSDLLNLDFKAITGTDLIVIKFIKFGQKHLEYLRYYNKKEKKYYKNQFQSLVVTHPYVARYQITPFFETLLPVQT